jgi:phytoene synthase
MSILPWEKPHVTPQLAALRLPVAGWEAQLVAWAQDALESHAATERVDVDRRVLLEAYLHCERLSAVHSRTFHLAAALLPVEKRSAVRALYAFCRVTDDLVDRAAGTGADVRADLDAWRHTVQAAHPYGDNPVALAAADARAHYRIPVRYAEQLIDGVACELTTHRYPDFESLAGYCYGVASTVGLMAMHIIGFADARAVPYAVKLGVALQLTNILRDVGEDWRLGRLYLPQDELAAFGLGEDDIAAGRVDARWQAFMRFQIQRTRRLYAEAMPGIAMLDPDGRFAIGAAAELYRAILTDIEAHGGDVFTRRAHVGTFGKLRRLPGVYWRAKASARDWRPA